MKTRTDRWLVAACVVCLVQPASAFPKNFEHQAAATVSRGSVPATDSAAVEPEAQAETRVTAAMAELPMCFEENVGQSDSRVAFLSRTSGAGVFLTSDELVLALRRPAPAEQIELAEDDRDVESLRPSRLDTRTAPLTASVLRMRLTGALASTPAGEQELEAKTNYFIGDDPQRWHTDVANFARVRYPEVYPGVDLVYYSAHGQLEYDLVVAPGADPSAIAIEWEGADSVEVDETGALVLKVDGGELRQQAPLLYQEDETGRRPVAGTLAPLGGGRFGLRLGAYDRGTPLVIDPSLVYSLYLGGTLYDSGLGIALDAYGCAYTAGESLSSDFPIQGGIDDSNLDADGVVTKLNLAGNAIVYSTYLGGYGYDAIRDIAVDSSGGVAVTGHAEAGFPLYKAVDSTMVGGEAFVTKLSPGGDALVFSTLLGGSAASEEGDSIGIDSSGAVYVAGHTASDDFPTTLGAYDPTFNGNTDVFVAKLHLASVGSLPSYLHLDYSTYLGGGGYDGHAHNGDVGVAIAASSDGYAYVAWMTSTSDLPLSRAFDTSFAGEYDAVVTKLDPQGHVTFASYLGGSGYDVPHGIAVDPSNNIYVTGTTDWSDFPTVHAYDATFNGGGRGDAFVTKLRPTYSPFGASYFIDYSTYLGGSLTDVAQDIAVDRYGDAYVTGYTDSANFPMSHPFDFTLNAGNYDIFVTKLSPDGTALAYSTYVGGSGYDEARSVAVDAAGAAYITGWTDSPDLRRLGGYPVGYSGNNDAFVMKLF